MFSPSKLQKQGMDVPKIVSMWPFSNAHRQSLNASVVLCSHSFLKKSVWEDSRTVGQDIPGKGMKAGSSKSFHTVHLSGVILPPTLSALAELLYELSEVKVKAGAEAGGEAEAEGEVEVGVASYKSAQQPYNNSSVEGVQNVKQRINNSTSDSSDQYRTSDDDGSTLHQDCRSKSSVLHSIDKAFLHQNALSTLNSHTKKDNIINPIESVVSTTTTTTTAAASSSSSSSSSSLLDSSLTGAQRPKIPMKFSIRLVDPSSRYSSSSSSSSTSTANDGSIALRSQNENPSSTIDGTENGVKGKGKGEGEGKGSMPWVAKKRTLEEPYFIVRTKSSTSSNAFCYYPELKRRVAPSRADGAMNVNMNLSGAGAGNGGEGEGVSVVTAGSRRKSYDIEELYKDADTVSMSSTQSTFVDGDADQHAGSDAVEVVMRSRAPLLELRWCKDDRSSLSATSSSPSSSSSSSTSSSSSSSSSTSFLSSFSHSTSTPSIIEIRTIEDRGNTQAVQPPSHQTASSRDKENETFDSGTELTVNKKKRKIPLNDITSSSSSSLNAVTSRRNKEAVEDSYEVVSSADLPVLYVVAAQHSCTIMKEKKDLELAGALLNPLNEYDIYAPETIHDKERRRQTM